ncbi:Hint domain-containing protein [Streptomyces sp. NBC_01306]|uniref:Hint domain-containing protein n=1 Tax=Streptomyces sp. NBC_01306 TaxID=2903819 RepID=UPI00224D02A4|nr:Hint domain-containing protein [Streptomyces sp. NBC_01306]MCX4723772.1 Hint domain-containing protein [Streptomyces sp. NBC_01306]
MAEFNAGIDPVKILLGDFIECAQRITPGGESGSFTGCAWAATWFVGGKALAAAAEAVRALDASLRTGIGIGDAWKGLKAVGLSEDAIAGIAKTEGRELATGCKVNSFPAGTRVLLADGTSRAIDTISDGDQLLATDPNTGATRSAQVTATFSHHADQFVDITTADGGRVRTTPGHRLYVPGSGWVLASDLHPRDRLRSPAAGPADSVVRVRTVHVPQAVWDLTVADLHTFYVLAGSTPVLVHNCDGQLSEELYAEIEHTHGQDVADGVDWMADRMHDGSATALDHEIPGIGHNLTALGDYLADWRGRLNYNDVKQGSRVAYDQARGTLVVENSYMIHAYQYDYAKFKKLVDEGRYVLQKTEG